MNDTFLKACRGEAVSHTPIWIMRQAGRYLPDYHKVRSKMSFLELCKTPEKAAEVTMQPVDILGVDAAILFSDILVTLEAMGMDLDFKEKQGPVLANPVRCQADLDRLIVPDPVEKLGYVMAAIQLLRKELATRVPLIGFSGAPFTLSTYAIEGGSSKAFWNTKKMMYTNPELYHGLMRKITDSTITYLQAQAEAGAQALQIFDSWAGVLTPGDFAEFALPYVQDIIKALKPAGVPLIYFANNCAGLLDLTKTSGADVLGIDWRVDIPTAIKVFGPDIAIQGNLDPIALLLPEEKLEKRIAAILERGKAAKGHIFNLGHGILPETPPEKAKFVVDTVHRLSKRM
ncbi:MAG: uroporphyrinogen decarboxylase [Desulfurivibrionaceae bacterium]|nr:uroporphyrinogen decarboxylase [Desulfurivibrionaceae bacterium]